MKYRTQYIKKNWKLIIHLLLGTYYFGVNNQWWVDFPSMFGKPWYLKINPFQIRRNYKGMEFRAVACYFVAKPWLLFPKHPKYNQPLDSDGKKPPQVS